MYYSIKKPLTFSRSLSCNKASTSKAHEKKIMLATSQEAVFSTSRLQRANRNFLPAVGYTCNTIFSPVTRRVSVWDKLNWSMEGLQTTEMNF